jgi:hypothetical protein
MKFYLYKKAKVSTSQRAIMWKSVCCPSVSGISAGRNGPFFGKFNLGATLQPLLLIRDNYEKTILTMDKTFTTDYEGIRLRNIIDFLLEAP